MYKYRKEWMDKAWKNRKYTDRRERKENDMKERMEKDRKERGDKT